MIVWEEHLKNCRHCRKAMSARFAGKPPAEMLKLCCEDGAPLYQAHLEKLNEERNPRSALDDVSGQSR